MENRINKLESENKDQSKAIILLKDINSSRKEALKGKAGNNDLENLKNNVNSQIKEQTVKIKGNSSGIEDNSKKILKNEQQVKNNKSDISTNTEEIKLDKKGIEENKRMGNIVNENKLKITKNASNIEGNSQKVLGNEKQITANKNNISTNAQGVKDGKNQSVANKKRLDNINNGLTPLYLYGRCTLLNGHYLKYIHCINTVSTNKQLSGTNELSSVRNLGAIAKVFKPGFKF